MSVPNSASSPYARNLNVVKMYFKKPMALIISVLSLVVLIMNFVISSSTQKIAEAIAELAQSGTDVEITTSSSNGIFGYLISGIVIACFFMIYFFSVSPGGNPSPFFKVLHIFSVIELILSAIASLLIVVLGLVSILSINTVVTYIAGNVSGFELINPEELERSISSYKPTLFLLLAITIVILAIVLTYINAQTAFLKSCSRSCKEPSLFTKGAKTFGNLSIVLAVLQFVVIVIAYVSLQDAETISNYSDFGIDLSAITTPLFAYYLINAVTTLLKGTYAKGWEPFAKENEDYVYAAASSASHTPEANPIATYKSTTRRSNEAIKQSQPYLYGEEPNNDPNKKSSYIPEELQNDYPPQYDQQPMGNDPFMGDPFAQPMQPMQPMGSDPYAPDPFAQSPMGNPYGQPPMDPNSQNPYNNGFM